MLNMSTTKLAFKNKIFCEGDAAFSLKNVFVTSGGWFLDVPTSFSVSYLRNFLNKAEGTAKGSSNMRKLRKKADSNDYKMAL